MIETIDCLYCQTKNTVEQSTNMNDKSETQQCKHCGMALPQSHPNSVSHRTKWFPLVFTLILLFCFVMVFYLPR